MLPKLARMLPGHRQSNVELFDSNLDLHSEISNVVKLEPKPTGDESVAYA